MVNLFLMNLGTNEGAWLNSLPLDEEEISSFIRKHRISTPLDEEFIIADYESDDCPLTINEYSNVWQINQALMEFAELDEEQQLLVKAYMENHSGSIDGFYEALEVMDSIGFDSSIEDYTDLGYFLTEGLFDSKDSILSTYFDYEAYGRDYCWSGYADITSYGCLFY